MLTAIKVTASLSRPLFLHASSILFSTHIISDLEKCADEITYIRNGKLIYTGHISGFAGEQVSLEDAMVQYEKEGLHEKFADERV